MIDFTEFERRNQEQMREMARAVQQERLAARAKTQRAPFDLQCWVMSRIEYLGDLAKHWIGRLGHTLPDNQSRPVLSDCR
ncbi:MAG: hypothetical protein GX620_11280 [Chloroflexi bacterium]|nr:hypothetical protein [Chloroflexota bacterium]